MDYEFICLCLFAQFVASRIFKSLEERYPRYDYPERSEGYIVRYAAFGAITGALFLAYIIYAFDYMIEPVIDIPDTPAGFIGSYLVFSFIFYWWHRAKHYAPMRGRFDWVHWDHHAPKFLRSEMFYFRHSGEAVLNLAVTWLYAQFFGLSPEQVIFCLTVEGILEAFHHANIKDFKGQKLLSLFIQTPNLHLVHHQRGVHSYNFGVVSLWDHIFGTIKYPSESFDFSDKIGLDKF